MASEIVCDVCGKAGVSEWFIRRGDREVRRLLCIVHGDDLRMLLYMEPENRHRYGNPGNEPLTRKWISAEIEVEPMDWMPMGMIPIDLSAGDLLR